MGSIQMPSLIIQTFIFLVELLFIYGNVDYWSDNFDDSKNCQNETETTRLGNLNPSQCKNIQIRNEDENVEFIRCKTELTYKIQEKCAFSKIDNPGMLLYCKNRGAIRCCYRDETCASWLDINKKGYNYDVAKEYLTNKEKVLGLFVHNQGYKSCHHIDSLNATACATDCKIFEKNEFGKNCTENGGLFKCCIRRDKLGCHECRYCCTLPMCTYPPGGEKNTIFDMEHRIELENQKNNVTAPEIYYSDAHIYKNEDYHCLKPDDSKDPKEWHKYEKGNFRQAYSKEMLENATTFKYDNNLYNFEDPTVFKAFTENEKRGREIWKKTYNFQYTRMIPGRFGSKYVGPGEKWHNMTKCIKKCIKMEKSKFARKCSDDGGYFKCCLSFWVLDSFSKTRNKLITDGLIKD